MLSIYDANFYDRNLESAKRSSALLSGVDIVLATVGYPNIKRVVDYGCGSGAFLDKARDIWKPARSLGVEGSWAMEYHAVRGIRHEVIYRDKLLLTEDEAGHFDLAICLEVAEHLDESAGEKLVDNICSVSGADIVVWSAARPGQGGENHINEREPWHWANLFSDNDYSMLDLVRPLIWDNTSIDWWYRQNTFVCVNRDSPFLDALTLHAARNPLFQARLKV